MNLPLHLPVFYCENNNIFDKNGDIVGIDEIVDSLLFHKKKSEDEKNKKKLEAIKKKNLEAIKRDLAIARNARKVFPEIAIEAARKGLVRLSSYYGTRDDLESRFCKIKERYKFFQDLPKSLDLD